MAKMTLKTDFDMSFLKDIIKVYPNMMYGVLSAVGYESRKILENQLLSGQYITLRVKPKDKKGRRTVNYSVMKNFKGVKISAYPLNLHDPKTAYKKLSPLVSSKLESILQTYDKNKFQKIIDQADKK